MVIERRYFKSTDIRMMTEPDKASVMRGMAALYNNLSDDLGGFREQIAPGFFTNALKGCDARCLWNHDSNHILGRTTSGTLRLTETPEGLMFEDDLPDTMCARDLRVSMDRGDVNQMSFGFTTARDSWDEVNGETIRTLIECEALYDVSPVTYPAYPDTTVAVRSKEQWKENTGPEVVDPDYTIGIMRRKLELKTKTTEATKCATK